ncbi:MAG: hypothetical protein K2W82_09170 [Candidatus Obscuribacterales bacterium]|nr:hypothetical protein [Candidatus Obscuribacterales bacterium]
MIKRYKEYSVQLVDCRKMQGAVLQLISDDLSRFLPELKIVDYFQSKPDILKDSDYVIVSRNKNGEAIGVLASKWHVAAGFDFLHIMTIFIAEHYQGTALFKRMWGLHFQSVLHDKGFFPEVFSLKTYNPISCSLLRRVARKADAAFYPDFKGKQSDWIKVRVQEIAAILEPTAEFVVESGVIKNGGGLVPQDFYPELPKSAKADIMSYFTNELTAKDRLLCCLFCPNEASGQNILQQFAA